jgi:hypothetical protein
MATTTAVSKLDALTFIKNSFSPFSRMMLTVRLLLTKVDPMVIIMVDLSSGTIFVLAAVVLCLAKPNAGRIWAWDLREISKYVTIRCGGQDRETHPVQDRCAKRES